MNRAGGFTGVVVAMEIRVVIAGKTYGVDLNRPKNLAIPLHFDGPQPNFFGASRAHARPFRGDGFIGDTRHGGSCNVSEIYMVPHCNGTHTEAVSHIVHAEQAVFESLPQSLMPAVVISVTPVPASESGEVYRPATEVQDAVITRAALVAEIADYRADELTALVVRTLPNEPLKKTAEYGDRQRPPFFTTDAMTYLMERGVQHLVVDIPSIDKMRDEGELTNHHIFWNVPEGAREATHDMRLDKTITEMVFVDDEISDGLYLLNLQVPAFHADAAPCRPVIYSLT
jgi:kynurenine formamidase